MPERDDDDYDPAANSDWAGPYKATKRTNSRQSNRPRYDPASAQLVRIAGGDRT